MENSDITAKVLKKLWSSDAINDDELITAIDFLKLHVQFLESLGSIYHLVWRDLNDQLRKLQEFRDLRGLGDDK